MLIRKFKNYILAAMFMLAAAGTLTAYADQVQVEVDEFGAAYVLKEDGTKDYNNVPMTLNNTEAEQSRVIMHDPNSYDLGVNGPTKDQAALGIPAGMSEEYYAKLNDNVIEWGEVEDLVKYWNPTYRKFYDQANVSIQEMYSAYGEFASQMDDAVKTADAAIADLKTAQELLMSIDAPYVPLNGKIVAKETALNTLKEALAQAEAGRKQAAGAVGTTKRSLYYAGSKLEKGLAPLRNQMVAAVETLIITYKTLEVNRSLVAEQLAMYEALYSMQSHLAAQNMATGRDVSGYLNQVNTAKKTLAELDSGLDKLKKNIAIQCGYNISTEFVIADLPAPDVHFMDGRNRDADKKQAVDGNSAVVSAGKLRNYESSSYGMMLRDMGENEARGKASAAFDGLYNEVQKQIILADSAVTTQRKAELSANAAQVKYNSGMVGRAEYEGLRMQYMASQATAKLASLNLHQALENYKFALLGVMTVE